MSKEATIARMTDTYGAGNFKEVNYEHEGQRLTAFFRRPSLGFFDTLEKYVLGKGSPRHLALAKACVKECFLEGDKGFLYNPAMTVSAFESIQEYIEDFQAKAEKLKKPSPAKRSPKKEANSTN